MPLPRPGLFPLALQLGPQGKGVEVGSMVTLKENALSSSAYRQSHLHRDRSHLHRLSRTGTAHSHTFRSVPPGPSWRLCLGRVPPHPYCPCLGPSFFLSKRQSTLCRFSSTCCRWCSAFFSCAQWSYSTSCACSNPFTRSLPSQPGRRPLVEAEGWPQSLLPD